jgi:uncharacterized protein YndB with AHSA1/START domain
VWDAHTKPELLRRWFAPPSWTLTECRIDLRPGGDWRYVMVKDTGETMGLGGTFTEVVAPERIVTSEYFDDPWYQGSAVDTSTFTEHEGKTTLTLTVLYDSKEIRDAIIDTSGMIDDMELSYARLDEGLPSWVSTT